MSTEKRDTAGWFHVPGLWSFAGGPVQFMTRATPATAQASKPAAKAPSKPAVAKAVPKATAKPVTAKPLVQAKQAALASNPQPEVEHLQFQSKMGNPMAKIALAQLGHKPATEEPEEVRAKTHMIDRAERGDNLARFALAMEMKK